MAVAVQYGDNIFIRFINHGALALKSEVRGRLNGAYNQQMDPNWGERLGDIGLTCTLTSLKVAVQKTIGALRFSMTDPKIITIAFTALIMIAVSFAFYPVLTAEALSPGWIALKVAICNLPIPPLWSVKFAAYIWTELVVLSYATRAFGRFTNEAFMNAFYRA